MKLRKVKGIEITESIIGSGTFIKGSVTSAGNLYINGNVEGDIESEQNVVVGSTGIVRGNISAENVTIEGITYGNIKANAVKVGETAMLSGDCLALSLSIADGATFAGNCAIAKENEDEINIETVKPVKENPYTEE